MKKPPVLTDRGRNKHGTTSGLIMLHSRILRPSNNGSRDIGRTRFFLLEFQKNHSGRYLGIVSHCLAPTGSSLAKMKMLTSSLHCVVEIILTKFIEIVKGIP